MLLHNSATVCAPDEPEGARGHGGDGGEREGDERGRSGVALGWAGRALRAREGGGGGEREGEREGRAAEGPVV